MGTGQIVALILGSSVIAGIVSAFTQLFVGRKTRQHATTEREAQQTFNQTERTDRELHEQILRREAAHDAARDAFLPMAQDVQRWLEKEELDKHWEDEGTYRPPTGNSPVLGSAGDAVDLLTAIATGHPTRRVRLASRALLDKITGTLGDVNSGWGRVVSFDEWAEWESDSRALIEAIHTPDAAT